METAVQTALRQYFSALETLKNIGVILNQKDFTSQLGEWLVENLYGGKRAKSGIQKDYDVITDRDFIQVKTHAKARTTSARFSKLKFSNECLATKVVIVVFDQSYKLKELYDIPIEECLKLIRYEKNSSVLYWNHLKNYSIAIEILKKNNLISAFV